MGKPRNTQKYPTYPEIPEIPGNTRKKKRYPEIPDRIFRHSYPTRTRPATRYFVQYPTRPDIEKPYPLGTDLVLLLNDKYYPRIAITLIIMIGRRQAHSIMVPWTRMPQNTPRLSSQHPEIDIQ